jgi:hypothetical protein
MYSLKRRDDGLLRGIKAKRSEVSTTINELNNLAGLPEVKYDQITIDKLKELKNQGFSHKVAKIQDLDHCLEAMAMRLQQLSARKEELVQRKQALQNQQVR